MPSLEHSALVDLFRQSPQFAARLLADLLQIPVPPNASATIVEGALDQTVPVELRADLVVEITTAAGERVLVVAVEVQLREDRKKKYSWADYVVAMRSRKRCPACVLVIAPDAKVAAWAAAPIELGPGPSVIRPLVLGPAELPQVTDPEVARREPALAVLSARAHGNGPDGLSVVKAALAGLDAFDPTSANVYLQIVYDALREPMRRALEALMEHQEQEGVTLPPFAQRLIARGKAEGKVEGKAEGKAEGELVGMRAALFRCIVRAGIALTDEHRARINACNDLATIEHWIDASFKAKTAAELLG